MSTHHMRWKPTRSANAPPRQVRRRPSLVGRDLAQGYSDLGDFGTLCKLHTLPAPPSTPPGFDPLQEECERSTARTKRLLEEESLREMSQMSEDEMWMRLARLLERPPLVRTVEGTPEIPSRDALQFLRGDTAPLEPLDEPEFRARLRDISQHPEPGLARIGLEFPEIPRVFGDTPHLYCSSCFKKLHL